jgi:hypothetical protein
MNLPSLGYRRLRGDALEVYKHLHGIYKVDCTELLPLDNRSGMVTRGHSLRLQKRDCRTALRANSFGMRVVNFWNSLPEGVVQAPSVNIFKQRFDTLCGRLGIQCSEEPDLGRQALRTSESWLLRPVYRPGGLQDWRLLYSTVMHHKQLAVNIQNVTCNTTYTTIFKLNSTWKMWPRASQNDTFQGYNTLKMHWLLGQSSGPHRGSLQHSPRPSSWCKGAAPLRCSRGTAPLRHSGGRRKEGMGEKGKGRKGQRGERIGGEGEGLIPPPRIPGSAPGQKDLISQ